MATANGGRGFDQVPSQIHRRGMPALMALLLLLQLAAPSRGQLAARTCMDVDGDGRVGVSDVLGVLGAFGQRAGVSIPTDMNGDGSVDVADLLLVLGAYGHACSPPSTPPAALMTGVRAVVGSQECVDLTVDGHESRTSCVYTPDAILESGSTGLPLIIVLCARRPSPFPPRLRLRHHLLADSMRCLSAHADMATRPITARSSRACT